MVKRASDNSSRNVTDPPPSKKTRGRAETDMKEDTAGASTRSATNVSGSKAVNAPAMESSETDSTGPTTPHEWSKTDDETENVEANNKTVVDDIDVTAPIKATVSAKPATTTTEDSSVAGAPNVGSTHAGSKALANANSGSTDGTNISVTPAPSGGAARPAGSRSGDPTNVVVGAPSGEQAGSNVTASATAVTTPLPPTSIVASTSAPAMISDAEVAAGPVIATTLTPSNIPTNPSLEEVKALFNNIDYVPGGDKRRMLEFARKKDDVNLRYGISQVPSNAKWGSTPKTAKFLCVNDKPITIWAVGDVQTTWFRDLQGNPHDRVNVGFKLPFAPDGDGLKHLYSLARPSRDLDDVVYAARRMVVYRKGEIMPTILPFGNLFDARKRFQAKSQMQPIESSAISKRDIVLVEGKFTRWNSAKDKRGKREWKLWGVGLELEAISLLYEAPPDVDPEPTDEVADIDDDM